MRHGGIFKTKFGQKVSWWDGLAKRRSRHMSSQMKYFGSPKYAWRYAQNKKRDVSLFGR